MSELFLWIGLTLIVGVPPVLSVLKVGSGSPILAVVGGISMIVGCVLLLTGR
jgi:hypothetical protein